MGNTLDYLAENAQEIKTRVIKSALQMGKKPEDVTMIAVTKTVGIDKIKKIVDLGFSHLGENRVQELCEKYDNIDKKVNWHFIGHLQTNKVKYIIDKVTMIHSLDRMELAQEIQKRAQKLDRVVNVLVQVNVADEATKYGLQCNEVLPFIKTLDNFPNIRVKGLMTVAPYCENPTTIRWVFTHLNKLSIDIKKEKINNIDMEFLSMGMSNDFEVAIEEGANMLRIGTSLFGKRQY